MIICKTDGGEPTGLQMRSVGRGPGATIVLLVHEKLRVYVKLAQCLNAYICTRDNEAHCLQNYTPTYNKKMGSHRA